MKLPNEVRLYHGIAAGGLSQSNEAVLKWTRAIEDNVTGEMLSIGNQGDIFLRSERGVYRLRADASAQREPIKKICQIARGEVPGTLGKVVVDRDGREMFYEHITPDEGIKGKLRSFFKKGQSATPQQVHSLHQHTPPNPQTEHLKFLVDADSASSFHWGVAPKFRWLVATVPEKKLYRVQVIDVSEQSVQEFELARTTLGGVWVSDGGAVLIDIREPGSETLIVAYDQGGKLARSQFQPPPGAKVLHLAHNYVALSLGKPPRLLLYAFNGSLIADVDVSPLLELGIQFGFNFNERGDIDVMTWQNGQLFVHHSDTKSILTDAKRWSLVARQSQMDTEEQVLREATAFHVEEKRRIERVEMSRQLAAAVSPDMGVHLPKVDPKELPRIATPEPVPFANPVPMAAAPSPLQRPEAPRKLEMQSEAAPAPPTLPSPPEAPMPPAPAPAPAPEPLPFLRGGPMLPPPMTEEEESSPSGEDLLRPVAPEPEPVPAPPAHPLFGGAPSAPPNTEPMRFPIEVEAEPVAAPVAESAPAADIPTDPASVEAELEKLRMHYIAGELTREEYYKRRAPLEAARRSGPRDSPEAGVASPRRLELDLDKASTPGPAAPSKPRLSGRRIDIGEVLRIDGADDPDE